MIIFGPPEFFQLLKQLINFHLALSTIRREHHEYSCYFCLLLGEEFLQVALEIPVIPPREYELCREVSSLAFIVAYFYTSDVEF